MSLQLLRGQTAKSPLRAGQEKPAASTVLQSQNAKQLSRIGQTKAKPRLSFPVGEETRAFYRRFYPGTTTAEWNDWHWQFQARIRSAADLEKVFILSDEERAAATRHKGPLPVGITPYYASLMGREDPNEPLRRTHVISTKEDIVLPGESIDPLAEDHDTAAPGIVHRYPDRVLFLTTGTCSTYCRYCTRARAVGNPGGEYQFSPKQWEQALAYLEEHTEVRDVLMSGGDPFSIADEKLDYLLTRLRKMKHIEFLRFGTKIPMVLPQRITKDFVKMLKKHHPLFLSIHALLPLSTRPGERLRPLPHQCGEGAGDHRRPAWFHHRLCHPDFRGGCAGWWRQDPACTRLHRRSRRGQPFAAQFRGCGLLLSRSRRHAGR